MSMSWSEAEAWRVWVTDADIRQATDAWLSALDGGAPEDRVEDLRDELRRLWRAEASQVAVAA
jgi:hypothetical protein